MYISHVNEDHLIMYSCGSRSDVGRCEYGWISGYAKHSFYNDDVAQHFLATQLDMCMEYEEVFNATQTCEHV